MTGLQFRSVKSSKENSNWMTYDPRFQGDHEAIRLDFAGHMSNNGIDASIVTTEQSDR